MKIIITSLLLLFSTLQLSIAQSLGIKIITGLDRTYRQLDNDILNAGTFNGQELMPDQKTNLRFGIDLMYRSSKHLSYSIGIRRVNQAYYTSIINDLRWPSEHDGNGGYRPDPNLPNKAYTVKSYNFIEVPLSIKYNVNTNFTGLWLEAGLSYNRLLKAESYFKLEGTIPNGNPLFNDDLIDRNNFSLNLQIGYGFKVMNNFILEPSIAYRRFLNSFPVTDEVNETIYNWGPELSLSYLFSKSNNTDKLESVTN